MRYARISAAALIVSGALMMTGCGGTPASPSPTSATAHPDTAPSPTESESVAPSPAAAPAKIPADCGSVGSAATRSATVNQMTEHGDAAEFTRPSPPGASLALGCNWIIGDATGYLLMISRAPDAAGAQSYAESTLPGLGYSCQVGDAPAFICAQTTHGTTYPVDTVETVCLRDGVWIYQSATNTDGEALLTDLVAGIWGS